VLQLERPDLVLVTLDTVGAKHCSTYGYRRKTTPALSKLAGRGVLFEHAYAPGSSTQRALMPLVSGRGLTETPRSAGQWPTISEEVDTLAERLGRAGYATAAVVSFTWLRKDRWFHQGFDHFDESPFREHHPERKVTGPAAVAAAKAIHDRLAQRETPLFLWVHLFDAHTKYLAHDGIDFGGNLLDRYDGEVAFVDRQLAALWEHVEAGPRAERTLWVVHGSHGEAFGEHGKTGHGVDLYDEVLRVPLVVAGHGLEPARYGTRAVSTLDIAPTIVAFAGAGAHDLAGVSLRPIIAGDRSRTHPPVWARSWRRTCVIDWPLKLLVHDREDKPERLLLFDLAADPAERKDVSADRPEDFRRLDGLRRKRAASSRG